MSKSDLISIKQSTTFPALYVKKYHRRVFYDNLWHTDPELIECRGVVVDENDNVVIRPFTKVFNHHENGVDIPSDELCLAVRKINGFMAGVTWVPAVNDCVISTTGSLDSDYVMMAREYLEQTNAFDQVFKHKNDPMTFLFEIVHRDDPHVIPEEFGAYLLGGRFVDDDAPYMSTFHDEMWFDSMADHMKVKRPEYFESKFGRILDIAKSCKHEGFVVYGKTTSLKLKSPYYLITKFLGRMGHAKLARMAENPLSFKQQIDEEFYPLLDAINEIKDEFVAMDEQARMNYIRIFLGVW